MFGLRLLSSMLVVGTLIVPGHWCCLVDLGTQPCCHATAAQVEPAPRSCCQNRTTERTTRHRRIRRRFNRPTRRPSRWSVVATRANERHRRRRARWFRPTFRSSFGRNVRRTARDELRPIFRPLLLAAVRATASSALLLALLDRRTPSAIERGAVERGAAVRPFRRTFAWVSSATSFRFQQKVFYEYVSSWSSSGSRQRGRFARCGLLRLAATQRRRREEGFDRLREVLPRVRGDLQGVFGLLFGA